MADPPRIGSKPAPRIAETPEAKETQATPESQDVGQAHGGTRVQEGDRYSTDSRLVSLPDEGSEGSGVKPASPDEVRGTEVADGEDARAIPRHHDKLHAVKQREFAMQNPDVAKTPILEDASYMRVQEGDTWQSLLGRYFERFV